MTATVLRLVTRLNIGGPARQALLLTRELSDEFPTVLGAGRPRSEEGELQDPAVEVVRLPLTRPIRPAADWAAVVATRQLIRDSGAQLVHTHMAKAGTVGRVSARLMADQPRTVHTFHGHVLDGYFSPAVRRGFLETERWLARKTDLLVAVSPEVRDSLLALGIGRPGQYHVLPVGIDLSPFLAVGSRTGRFRHELGLNADTSLIGAVGRLVPVKGHATLLRSLTRLPGVHLAVIGDGEIRRQLERQAETDGLSGRVHFVGWRDDMPDVMSDLDTVVLTSVNEGTPVALIEALAAGRPVVATDVGGVSHVVKHERTGLLAPRGDEALIAERIRAILDDPEKGERLATAGRDDVAGRFGALRLVEETREIYRSLLPAAATRAR